MLIRSFFVVFHLICVIITAISERGDCRVESTYLYLLAALVVCWAQMRVQGAYQRYKRIENEKHISGAEAARSILDANGLQDVTVEVAQGGILSDHYDPTKHAVRLSPDIYYNCSIASLAVAAHEVGHAIQHKEQYGFIAVRNRLLPAAQIASKLGWLTLLLGLFFLYATPLLLYIGIGMLVIIALFQLVTLPLELNASSRALVQLQQGSYVMEDEVSDCRSMLRAAAFTYVAALLSTIVQIIRIVLIAQRRDD